MTGHDDKEMYLRAEMCSQTLACIVPEIVNLDGRVMVNYGGLILPPPMTAEEWEAASIMQQAELCGEIAYAKP